MREVLVRTASLAATVVVAGVGLSLPASFAADAPSKAPESHRMAPQTRQHVAVVWLFHHMRPCPQEDSRDCAWNAQTRGNGIGHSFVDVNGHTYYVRPADQRRWGYGGIPSPASAR